MSAGTSVEDVSRRGDAASSYAQAAGLLISYQERVLAWQREAWRISFAEISLLQNGAFTAMRAVVRPAVWTSVYHDENERQRFLGLANMWLKLATELHVALLRAFGPPLTASDAATAVMPDRRVKSVVINFPERRVA
jgi:hypothetical protein